MSEQRWTPGPWVACDVFVNSKNGDAIVSGVGKTGCDEELESNAHLIAAAPELYQELAALQARVTDAGHEDDPDVVAMCGGARAALAKARGE